MEKENHLTRLREKRGMTQREVAEELDVTRQAVSQWERGAAFPSVEKQIVLSRLYGVALVELYAGKIPEETEALPEGAAEEAAEEAAPEADQSKPPRRNVKIGITILVICVMIGISLWGCLTNSNSIATSYLIFISLCLIVAWLIFFSYATYKHWRNNKNE